MHPAPEQLKTLNRQHNCKLQTRKKKTTQGEKHKAGFVATCIWSRVADDMRRDGFSCYQGNIARTSSKTNDYGSLLQLKQPKIIY